MSLRGNNAHWATPRVLYHQSFNGSYDRVYFQPDGTILKVFSWLKDATEIEPNDEVRAAVESALRATIIGLKVNMKGEEGSGYSPYVVINWMGYGISQLKKAYFSEHTTSDYGWNEKICKLYPVREEDVEFFNSLVKKSNLIA